MAHFQGGGRRSSRRYSGVGVLSEIINLSATPKSTHSSKDQNASSFGLAAEMASFQPPKPKYHAQLAPVKERELNGKSTGDARVNSKPTGSASVLAESKKTTKAKPFQALGNSKATSDTSAARPFTEEKKAVTPPPTTVSTNTSHVPLSKKASLACDSTRKKRNRRKTVCFGDWVTGTPPPALSRSHSQNKKDGKKEKFEEADHINTVVAAQEVDDQAVATTPSPPPNNSCKKKTNGSVLKTPSHAEILNMSKELNSLASTLLPETPGTVEKGGLTLKERLAESWCGKSYYERLAEMNSYEGDAQESDEEDATIDDLQSALQNALSKTKVSSGRPKKKKNVEKAEKMKSSNRRKSTRRKSLAKRKDEEGLLQTRQLGVERSHEVACDEDEVPVLFEERENAKEEKKDDADEENRRKSWADVVADGEEGGQLAVEESTSDQKVRDQDMQHQEALKEKKAVIDSLKSALAEERRKNVVLECQKEEMAEEKTHMMKSLTRLKDFATQLSQQVLELNRELNNLSDKYNDA